MAEIPTSLFPQKKTKKSISNLDNLADALGVEYSVLENAKSLGSERYRSQELPKSGGGVRKVYDPHPLIRTLQGRINKRIFIPLVSWPKYLYGSLPNEQINNRLISRDYIECAKQHCLSKSLLKVDISNFFDNIHRDYVYEIFSNFLKFPEQVSSYLTDICCLNDFIVQGGLTSSYIATLVFWEYEGLLVKRLERKGLTYTRLVDDITVSSKVHNFNFDYAEKHIKLMLLELDLPINDSKTKVVRSGIEPLQVHGLRVNYSKPRLPSHEVKRIKAAVHNVIKMSKVNNYRTTVAYRKAHDRCMGRVNKLARIGHNKHSMLKNQLIQALPLPSKSDIKKAERSISRLERTDPTKLKKRNYMRKFFLVQYRILIISRTYKSEAKAFRNRLNQLRSNLGEYEK
ncbi:reverse transcriptase family protein [Microbulbifer sp. TRSA007]|uniref:reverse transcriptase family protein n=1 Tax=Microbulbifer sp. TRSA007 TaxID=3243384 RepID=UPI00403A1F09